MRISCLQIAALVLISAAPAGAALPEDGVQACQALGETDLIYVGQAGARFGYQLRGRELKDANDAFLKVKAEYERSPDNAEIISQFVSASRQLGHWMSRSVETTLAPIRPERVFRGHPAGESFIIAGDGATVEEGRSYLFYAASFFTESDLFIHQPHGPSRKVSEAQHALRLLEASATGANTGVIYGAVAWQLSADRTHSTALAGINVRVTAPKYVENLVTDAEGIFIAAHVPPGKATVTLSLPDRVVVIHPHVLTSNVVEGHCSTVDVQVALNGRIRGRIIGRDGMPMQNGPLQLLPRESKSDDPLDTPLATHTNKHGEFEFRAIPPGSYVLAHPVRGAGQVAISEQKASKAIYYPGTFDLSAAVPIVVGNATQQDGVEFRLP
jgi:hypothetical protein